MSSANTPSETAPPSTTATYNGSCHCNRFTYTVEQSPPLDDPACQVTDCNCSICSRNGYLLIYVPDSSIKFEKGSADEFTKYTFAPKHKIAHYFCPMCGTSCFAKSTDPEFYADYMAVNVRTFVGVDIKALTLKFTDGKSL